VRTLNVDLESLTVLHNREDKRFEIRVDSYLAELTYRIQGEMINFPHTGVPRALEGQGVGSRLVRTGLEYAREHGLRVKTHCSFVTAYLERHPEYQDLI